MNAYLGLVTKLKESGDSSHAGHINRASRKTTRTLFTQSLVQVMFASPYLNRYYENVKERRGAGRGRIALIRKLCGIMRRMLLTGEQFREVNINLYNKKVRHFDRTIKIMEQEKKNRLTFIIVEKVIRGVKAKKWKNGDLLPKIGRNRRSGTNRPNLSVFKIL